LKVQAHIEVFGHKWLGNWPHTQSKGMKMRPKDDLDIAIDAFVDDIHRRALSEFRTYLLLMMPSAMGSATPCNAHLQLGR
jgi:hypothetical protein